MSLEALTAAIRRKLEENLPLNHTVLLDLGETGVVFIDGTVNPAMVDNIARPAETTLTLSPDLLARMLDGSADGTLAYMTGRLKVAGSIGVALKMNAVLGD